MFDPWVVLSNLSDPVTLLLMTLSACFGIIMGAVPGLSGTLGIALLLPFTFGLESATALLMLGSVYCGSEYGGSIPSILINTPGTAAALCTTFDGYPMAMKGQAQKALFTALISSVFGGIFGVSALLFLSVPLANVSMKFGAPEQFWLCVFALTIIASLSSGNVLKGVIGALMTHGLKPGFDLFSEQGDIVFTYTFGLILSNFIILLLGLVLVRIFVRALKIPQHFLVVAILALSVVGSYSISSSLMDVLSMAACGLLGYVLVRYKYGVAPMALGLILGTTMEEGFKLSLHLGAAEGNIMLFFFSRPQSLALIILTLLSLGYSIWKECGAKKV